MVRNCKLHIFWKFQLNPIRWMLFMTILPFLDIFKKCWHRHFQTTYLWTCPAMLFTITMPYTILFLFDAIFIFILILFTLFSIHQTFICNKLYVLCAILFRPICLVISRLQCCLDFPLSTSVLYGALNDIGASATLAPYFLVTLGPILLR